MKRKEKLGDRAYSACVSDGTEDRATYQRAYVKGYRVAMRDMRKAVRDPGDGSAEWQRIGNFLKPIR